MIHSDEKGKGHASELLGHMKKVYANEGKLFGSSVALNEGMWRLLKKFNIHEYKISTEIIPKDGR